MREKLSVSVVMPTYNGEKNIVEQLESIRLQTYPIKELIMSDDGSSDDTVSIVKQYIIDNNLTHWRIMENEHNLGWRVNFFNLLDMASGTLIFTSDQDDIWYKDKIEKMVTVFKNTNVNVLVSDYDELIEPGGVSYPCSKRMIKNVDNNKRIHFTKKNIYLNRPGWVYGIRSNFLSEINVYKENAIIPVHDITMWSVAVLTDSLYYLNESTGKWRKHGKSAIRNENAVDEKKGRIGIRLGKLNRLKEVTQSDLNYLNKTEIPINDKKNKIVTLQNLINEYTKRIKIIEKMSLMKLMANLTSYTAVHPVIADAVFIIKNK
ncbi:glycosyltransferase [Enterococcus dongliensis]|uniref:glycosyltransferase n=1 Tax=Enterococcus dongliensis TaxID=2559925 RepID=UPI00288DAE46|nr:glycosyltransferase [Enterococcus dongliensis]MDT2670806.1 glycosyltransferase [Enterococcus dongliensis]